MSNTSCVLLLLALTAINAHAESLRIEPKHAGFDIATASSTIRQTYTVTNAGDKRVRLREWKAIAGYGTVEHLPEALAPGESVKFDVVLPLPGNLGQALHRFALFTDEADVERYRFTLGGFVYSLISPAPAVLDLGSPRFDSTTTRTIRLEAREASPLALGEIVSVPDWLDVRVEGDALHARLKPGARLGIHAGNVRVKTNLDAQPFVDVTVRAIVTGALKPSVYALGMRPMHVGDQAQTEIDIEYDGKGRLADLAVRAPAGWRTTKSACTKREPKPTSPCTRVTLSTQVKESGRGNDVIRFEIPGEPALEVPFGTIALGREQTVRELVLAEQGVDAPQKLDIANDLAAQAREAANTPGGGDAPRGEKITHAEGKGPVHLRWQAANDSRVFGYMIYRATDRAGPFQRVSATPVRNSRASGTSGATRSDYDFFDDSVKPGKTYYYYIDAIASDGAQSRFSPVMSKKVASP